MPDAIIQHLLTCPHSTQSRCLQSTGRSSTGQSSPGEALSEAVGEPMSNESMDDTVASLLLPPWAPKEEWVLSGDLVVPVLVV